MKTLILAAALFQPVAAPTVPHTAASALRVAVVSPQPQPEAAFSIRAVPAPVPVPGRSLLIFSGLAAAFWMARRRLGHSF